MAKKKKKKSRPSANRQEQDRQEIEDEILALEAIYGDDFTLHDDANGFDLVILPENSEANYVSVELRVRYKALRSITFGK